MAILGPYLAIFGQLYVYLSQNWGSDDQFELLDETKVGSKVMTQNANISIFISIWVSNSLHNFLLCLAKNQEKIIFYFAYFDLLKVRKMSLYFAYFVLLII